MTPGLHSHGGEGDKRVLEDQRTHVTMLQPLLIFLSPFSCIPVVLAK